LVHARFTHSKKSTYAPVTFIAAVFLGVPFFHGCFSPQRVWKQLSNKKKVVIVVDGEGIL